MSHPAVTTNDLAHDPPVRTHDDLLKVFAEAEKPRSAWHIGPEMEKFGVYADSLLPIPYEGDRGVLRILRELQEKHGWQPELEYEGGPSSR